MPDTPPTNWIRRYLYESVTMLAADAQTQVSHLQASGLPVDELALEFDAVARACLGAGPPAEVAVAVTALSRHLDEMSGAANEELWDPESLERPEWAKARELAKTAQAAIARWQPQ